MKQARFTFHRTASGRTNAHLWPALMILVYLSQILAGSAHAVVMMPKAGKANSHAVLQLEHNAQAAIDKPTSDKHITRTCHSSANGFLNEQANKPNNLTLTTEAKSAVEATAEITIEEAKADVTAQQPLVSTLCCDGDCPVMSCHSVCAIHYQPKLLALAPLYFAPSPLNSLFSSAPIYTPFRPPITA